MLQHRPLLQLCRLCNDGGGDDVMMVMMKVVMVMMVVVVMVMMMVMVIMMMVMVMMVMMVVVNAGGRTQSLGRRSLLCDPCKLASVTGGAQCPAGQFLVGQLVNAGTANAFYKYLCVPCLRGFYCPGVDSALFLCPGSVVQNPQGTLSLQPTYSSIPGVVNYPRGLKMQSDCPAAPAGR
jgi:hypothetical protein